MDALGATAAPVFDAVIFDMDGVLIDSEPLWQRAEIEIFGELGVHLTPALCRQTMGLRIDEVVDHWYSYRPWGTTSRAEVVERVVERVETLIREEGGLLPGVTDALSFFRRRATHIALASSSYYRLIEAVLEGFDLADRFDLVHSAEDEPLGKPHPGIYLTVAAKLKVEAARCLAIEDSPNGVVAAKAARMRCIAIPEPGVEDDPRVATADALVASLSDISDELLSRL
ncbi:MAG: hexitol phosphatase HxpB [Actinomycetota bacterium]